MDGGVANSLGFIEQGLVFERDAAVLGEANQEDFDCAAHIQGRRTRSSQTPDASAGSASSMRGEGQARELGFALSWEKPLNA